MLKMPTKEDIATLQSVTKGPCVSIYMQTDEDSMDSHTANRIRFKNLLSSAHNDLIHGGLNKKEADRVLINAKSLLDDTSFWNIRRDGLAVFTNKDNVYSYGIPKSIADDSAHVEATYKLQPLENIVDTNNSYFVLSLGHKDVQLLAGDMYHVEDVTPDVLPVDMNKALRIDEQPSHLQNHEVAAERGQRANRSFHGQYNIKEEDKKDLMNFFRLIDNKINGLMHREGNPPLILAGVEYLHPLYKKANTYVNLSKVHISKNIQNMNTRDVLETIKPVINQVSSAT